MSRLVVVDVINDVVTEVQKRWDSLSVTPEKPYFYHGHLTEIVDTLLEKSQQNNWKTRKFPCIMLLQDFEEQHTADNINANLHIIIATHTKNTIKASKRYEDTFKPILYPLFDMLFEELGVNRSVNELSFDYKVIDRLYWGKESYSGNTANTATDFIDAIEITNLKVNLLKNC